MNKVSLILTALMTLALVLFIAPNVFAMSHGKILRNIALWLMVFLGLALIYKNFGPGSKMPLLSAPAIMQQPNGLPQAQPPGGAKTPDKGL